MGLKPFPKVKPPPKSKKERRESDPLEIDIENEVAAYAKTHGVPSRKYKNPGDRSAPDRIFFFDKGVVVFIEFKRRGRQPTKGQWKRIRDMRSQKTPVYAVDNALDGKRVIYAYLAYVWARNTDIFVDYKMGIQDESK